MDLLVKKTEPIIDIHIHLAISGCQCHNGWLHPMFQRRYTMAMLKKLYRITDKDLKTDFDTTWPKKISDMVKSSNLDYGVILGFDGVVDSSGHINKNESQLIVPHDWVFHCARIYPNLLPGPSINPHRKDALDILDECIDKKAVLIKWLPSAQKIDASNKNLRKFYQKVADSRIPLLFHVGTEGTFKSFKPHLNGVQYLRYPLDEGVKVICAHSGVEPLWSTKPDISQTLISMLHQYSNLWVDNSGLCNFTRFHHVPRLAKNTLLTGRMLHGSDWPIPAHAWFFLKDMGLGKVLKIEAEPNWLNKDMLIKDFYGFPKEIYTRAHDVLGNLSYWLKS